MLSLESNQYTHNNNCQHVIIFLCILFQEVLNPFDFPRWSRLRYIYFLQAYTRKLKPPSIKFSLIEKYSRVVNYRYFGIWGVVLCRIKNTCAYYVVLFMKKKKVGPKMVLLPARGGKMCQKIGVALNVARWNQILQWWKYKSAYRPSTFSSKVFPEYLHDK